jgi:hypothetical protein
MADDRRPGTRAAGTPGPRVERRRPLWRCLFRARRSASAAQVSAAPRAAQGHPDPETLPLDQGRAGPMADHLTLIS